MIARSRSFAEYTPLPSGIENIKSYLRLYDEPVDLHIFVDCLIALDNMYLDQAYEKK